MRLVLLVSTFLLVSVRGAERHGRQFISLGSITTGADAIYVSRSVTPEIQWDELVVSWNFRAPAEEGLTVDARVMYPDYETKWYCLGRWTSAPGKNSRESVKGQKDADGTVQTDILKMNRPGGSVQLRITTTQASMQIQFLGLSFCDSKAHLDPLAPNTNAWNKVLTVEERCQGDYPEGAKEWCSPTSTSMLLSFWASKLNRPELNHSVPETARAVNDPNWPGTGNWPFNTAFAGVHTGLWAYVARFSDVCELEDWIAAGIPVAFSVSYGFLQGKTERGGGHIVVAIGFTGEGDVIVNDPGRRKVRQIYKRANVERAWAESQNTVYLVYPEGARVPRDRFSHWTDK